MGRQCIDLLPNIYFRMTHSQMYILLLFSPKQFWAELTDEGDIFEDDLKELIEWMLRWDPSERPTIQEILESDYV